MINVGKFEAVELLSVGLQSLKTQIALTTLQCTHRTDTLLVISLTGTRLVKFWTKFKKNTALSAKWWHISCAIHIDRRQPSRAFSQKLERIFCQPYDTQRICYCVVSVVSRLSVTLCIVAKRCVLEQKLLLRAYRKSYMRNRLVPKLMTLTFV